jgi:hypothetical protein
MTQKITAEPKWQHRSFFDEVAAICPPFQHTPVTTGSGKGGAAGSAMYEDGSPPQRVMMALAYDLHTGEPMDVEFTMPFQAYVPAMDPAGRIETLFIRTSQVAADDPSGSYAITQAARKIADGWLILVRDPKAYGLSVTNDRGWTGEDFAEYARAEFLRRREANAQKMARSEQDFKSQALKSLEEQSVRQTEMIAEMGEASRKMTEDVVKAIVPALAGKGESEELAALRAEVAEMRKLFKSKQAAQ